MSIQMWNQLFILFAAFLGGLISPAVLRLLEDKLQRRSLREEARRIAQLETIESILERMTEFHIQSLYEVDRKRRLLVEGAESAPRPEPSELNEMAKAGHGVRMHAVRLLDDELRTLIQEYINDTAGLINLEIYNDIAHVQRLAQVLATRGRKYTELIDRLGEQHREHS